MDLSEADLLRWILIVLSVILLQISLWSVVISRVLLGIRAEIRNKNGST